MTRRVFRQGWCVFAALGCLILDVPSAWAQKPKEPKWTHAFDLMVRKYGEADFTDKTQKFGVEVFKDTNTNYGLYIAQSGFFGAAAGFEPIAGAIKDSKGAKWTAGLDLPARDPGVKEFTSKTKSWALEVFHDPNAGNWIYVTETGRLSVVGGPSPAGGPLKAPKWVHSVDLRCRKGGMREWKDAPLYGIEIYRDNNTGNLIYISNVGCLAVIPDSGESKSGGEGRAADWPWLHGLDLACRRSNEPDFTKDTKRWGVEVFRDETNGNLLYITESGALAVARGKKDLRAPTPSVKEPVWTHGLNLSARKAGEKEFTKDTLVYGAEVFRDDNTGLHLYIAETGAISIIPVR
jgi:hypothetical protein